jgi:protein TonB
MFTDTLPRAQLLTFLVAPPPPPPPPPPAAEQVQRVVRQIQTDMLNNGQLRTPSRIPQKVQMIKEEEAPPPMVTTSGVVGGVPGGIPGGQLGGVIGGIVSATSNLATPKFIPVTPQRVRISQGVTKGLLVHRVEPTYPALARAARVQGEVVLTAVISPNGDIENLQLVSGHPMLVPSALSAVKQWRYKPYLLNGQPVEVETTITVIFSLSS